MSLARSARALARLAAQPSSSSLPGLGSLVPAQQQLLSLWCCTPARGFAASAAAAQEPAAAQPPAAATDLPPVYSPLGETVGERYSVQPKRVFAVVEVGGTQYKVTPDDVIVVEKLGDVDVNEKLRLQRVLLLGSAAETVVGRPYVPGAAVDAAVEVRGEGRAGRGGGSGVVLCWQGGEAQLGGMACSQAVVASWQRRKSPTRPDPPCASALSHKLINCRSSSWTARCSSSTSGAGRTRGACAATARCPRG